MSTTRNAVAPASTGARISNLDTIRGLAVMGILVMNAVSYGLPMAAYFNLAAGGSDSWLDWVIGGAGEIFVDQKMMGLFSMLFGAGIMLFADRAEAKGLRPGPLSLWRNTLLAGIGLVHAIAWDGDILIVYALCAPALIVLRKRRPRTLLALGTAAVLWSGVVAFVVQAWVPADGSGLGSYWFVDAGPMSDAIGLFLLNDFFARAFGMMLIGVALYRLGVLQGTRSTAFYRRMARWGLGIGLPIAAFGLAIQVVNGFAPDIAVVGEIPNTVAAIPVVVGYVGLITLWNKRTTTWLHQRVRAVGRMALTNYLTQTAIGLVVLRGVLGAHDLDRTEIAIFVVAVWAIQLMWSKAWLDRFQYGPVEWLWRSATYRRPQPLGIRRDPPDGPGAAPDTTTTAPVLGSTVRW